MVAILSALSTLKYEFKTINASHINVSFKRAQLFGTRMSLQLIKPDSRNFLLEMKSLHSYDQTDEQPTKYINIREEEVLRPFFQYLLPIKDIEDTLETIPEDVALQFFEPVAVPLIPDEEPLISNQKKNLWSDPEEVAWKFDSSEEEEPDTEVDLFYTGSTWKRPAYTQFLIPRGEPYNQVVLPDVLEEGAETVVPKAETIETTATNQVDTVVTAVEAMSLGGNSPSQPKTFVVSADIHAEPERRDSKIEAVPFVEVDLRDQPGTSKMYTYTEITRWQKEVCPQPKTSKMYTYPETTRRQQKVYPPPRTSKMYTYPETTRRQQKVYPQPRTSKMYTYPETTRRQQKIYPQPRTSKRYTYEVVPTFEDYQNPIMIAEPEERASELDLLKMELDLLKEDLQQQDMSEMYAWPESSRLEEKAQEEDLSEIEKILFLPQVQAYPNIRKQGHTTITEQYPGYDVYVFFRMCISLINQMAEDTKSVKQRK